MDAQFSSLCQEQSSLGELDFEKMASISAASSRIFVKLRLAVLACAPRGRKNKAASQRHTFDRM
jgi:hypothetical protein